MTASASGRISAAKTGWVVVLLMVGWALFLILPFGRKEKIEPEEVAVSRPGEDELAAVGLSYNVDWIGLPEYFAVWAGRTNWQDDKVRFAYWNPGSNSYSYYFEATRRDGRYRFRAIDRGDLELRSGYYFDAEDEVITEWVPEPRTVAATHPFIFWEAEAPDDQIVHAHSRVDAGVVIRPLPPHVNVDMPVKKLEVPEKLDGDTLPNVPKG